MLTCFLRHEIDPTANEAFVRYARGWSEAIPLCGADLVGYFAQREGFIRREDRTWLRRLDIGGGRR